MPVPERPVAVIGCGYTDVTRKPVGDDTDLAVSACLAAAEDAGLDPAEIDGLNVQVHHYPPPATAAIAARLGMTNLRWQEDGGIGVGSLARAAAVLASGECHTILVCKVMNTIAPIATPRIDGETGGVSGPAQFEVPYGLGYTMQRVALTTRRWMHRYRVTPEQVGTVCVVQREHAMLNPRAALREPLTMEDYLSSRLIADPVRLYDCDYPVNGAYAYVLTTEDRARRAPRDPVWFLGWSDWTEGAMRSHLLPEEEGGMVPPAEVLYRDTGLRPEQMDVWMLYDGYSHWVLQWMENLGLVPRGQAGAYVEGGERIRHTGEHPVNTNGGQLSEGRLHGAGHIVEAVQQVRRTAGPRQAARSDFAIVSSVMPNAGAAGIFGREPRSAR